MRAILRNLHTKGKMALRATRELMASKIKSNMFRAKGIVLMYHRVNDEDVDPWALCVNPGHFAEHLEILRKHFCPMQMRHLALSLQDANIPDNSVVVTFDDGYADNFHNAKPLLARYDVPATIFLTTGYVGSGREFWWDELEHILLRPGKLPERLRLNVGGNDYEWDLGNASYYREESFISQSMWKAMAGDPPNARHVLYGALHRLLMGIPHDEQKEVMCTLFDWAGREKKCRSTHHPVSLEEAAGLIDRELIEMGAHTVTHPLLSVTPIALQRGEIRESKAFIEEVLGSPVSSFSYPFGNYNDETIGIVREAGFTSACTTAMGVVERGMNRYLLPRVQVEDWDGDEFLRQLHRWFGQGADGA